MQLKLEEIEDKNEKYRLKIEQEKKNKERENKIKKGSNLSNTTKIRRSKEERRQLGRQKHSTFRKTKPSVKEKL